MIRQHFFAAFLLMCFAAFSSGTTHAETPELKRWVLDRQASVLSVYASQDGQEFVGEFTSFDGEIFFNPDAPLEGHGRIVIDMGSFQTGHAERDKLALTPAWFDLEANPTAVFMIDRFVAADAPDQYTAYGRLTLRGITRKISLPFRAITFEKERKILARAMGETSLDRIIFGVGAQEPWANELPIGHNIKIRADITAIQKDAP